MTLTTPPDGTLLSDTTFPHVLWHSGRSEALYVHPEGDDNYDGASWGRAKETILGAYDALGAVGTIYIAGGSQVGGEVSGQGIWIAGTDDPDYGSLPSGWRQNKQVRFVGVSGSALTSFNVKAHIVPGTGQSTWSGPWIALASARSVEFHSLTNRENTNGYGIDMTRWADGATFTDSYACAVITFKNIESRCTWANAANGYNALKAFGSFWIWVEDCWLEMEAETANDLAGNKAAAIPGASESWTMTTATPTGWPAAAPFTMLGSNERVRVTAKSGTTYTVTRGYDDTQAPAHVPADEFDWILDPKDPTRAAVYLGNSTGNAVNYLWNMKNIVLQGGPIVTEGQSMSRFENIALEGCSGSAMYFIEPSVGNIVDMIDNYDMPQSTAFGIVDISPRSANPACVTIRGVGHGVGRSQAAYGPCTLLDAVSGSIATRTSPENRNTSLVSLGQRGFMDRRFYAQIDTSRRAGVAVAHHANLVTQTAGSWTGVSATGIADVFGLSNAGGGSSPMTLYSGSWNPSAPAAGEWWKQGDFVFFGAWLKGDGLWGGPAPIDVAITAGAARFMVGPFVTATGDAVVEVPPAYRGNNDWIWHQGFAKVSTAGSSTLVMRIYFGTTTCYPILFTTSAMRDAEAWETFHHLATYPTTAPAGSVSTFANQKLIANGGLGVGNSAAATTSVGALARKIEVFDASGSSLGFVPVYSTIT